MRRGDFLALLPGVGALVALGAKLRAPGEVECARCGGLGLVQERVIRFGNGDGYLPDEGGFDIVKWPCPECAEEEMRSYAQD